MKKIVNKKVAAKKTVAKKSPVVKVVNKPKKKSWLGFLAILNVLAFVAVIVVNYLAVSLPIA
jgi:hypothetical protein